MSRGGTRWPIRISDREPSARWLISWTRSVRTRTPVAPRCGSTTAASACTVDTVAAESLSEGVHSILTLNTLDQRNAAAVKWLDKNRRTFVMNDTLDPWDPEVAPEREVVETYGIRSEMVAPVIKDGDLVGVGLRPLHPGTAGVDGVRDRPHRGRLREASARCWKASTTHSRPATE